MQIVLNIDDLLLEPLVELVTNIGLMVTSTLLYKIKCCMQFVRWILMNHASYLSPSPFDKYLTADKKLVVYWNYYMADKNRSKIELKCFLQERLTLSCSFQNGF